MSGMAVGLKHFENGLKHSELTEKIITVFYAVYNELGHGFQESIYAEAMAIALEEAGLTITREVPVPVWFHEKKVGNYVADLLVENTVLVELGAARNLDHGQDARLLHCLRATEIEVGLLLNFGLRPRFRRLLFDNPKKKIRAKPYESAAKASA
jgi:GxxExxY protein